MGMPMTVLEQQFPGEEEPSEEDAERRGIPDGWIYDDNGWCVFIETKVISKLTADQIQRHRRTAERRGFEHITAVAITPRIPVPAPSDTVLIEWRAVYAFLQRYRSISDWAARAADFLEIAEAKLVDTQQFPEGTLTHFSGFPFGPDHPFTYLEGKRVFGLAMGELRRSRDLQKKLGMNPNASGRPAITGRRGGAVWDFYIRLIGAEDVSRDQAEPFVDGSLALALHLGFGGNHAAVGADFDRAFGSHDLVFGLLY
jgi:hypothetical protein